MVMFGLLGWLWIQVEAWFARRFCDRRDGRRRRRSILRVSCRAQAKPPWVANEIIRFKALATLISPFWIAFWKEGSLSFTRI